MLNIWNIPNSPKSTGIYCSNSGRVNGSENHSNQDLTRSSLHARNLTKISYHIYQELRCKIERTRSTFWKLFTEKKGKWILGSLSLHEMGTNPRSRNYFTKKGQIILGSLLYLRWAQSHRKEEAAGWKRKRGQQKTAWTGWSSRWKPYRLCSSVSTPSWIPAVAGWSNPTPLTGS